MKIIPSPEKLSSYVGTHLGYSEWHTITQPQIDGFAAATGDHQWIHVDVDRAASGPFGKPIAHGYLTVSMVSSLVGEIYHVDGVQMAMNYGADRLRFPAPVTVGSYVRGGAELTTVERTDLGYRVSTHVEIERRGSAKLVCIIDVLTLFVPNSVAP